MGISIALDKKREIFIVSHANSILYKIDSDGKLISLVTTIKNSKDNRNIPIKNIQYFSSDSYGNIYAFNSEAIEILKINSNLEIENSWFINFNLKSLPGITIGTNDKIFARLPEVGFIEYSPTGDIITQLLEEPKCNEKNIGARGKIAAYDRKKILLWFNKEDTVKVLNFDMETGNCNKEALGSYINFLIFDKKGRIVVLAPSWVYVVNFFYIKGNSEIYNKPFSPGAIAIDILNNYYIYNMDSHEILVVKDTGKINRIIKLNEEIKVK